MYESKSLVLKDMTFALMLFNVALSTANISLIVNTKLFIAGS